MFGGTQGWTVGDGGVTQLIRAAEKFIASNNFQLALEQLSVARQLDPKNTYISAIIDRVNNLRKDYIPPVADSPRYLSVTVGAEFPKGILEDEALSSKDLQVRIRQLTNVAEKFLEQGSCDNAFDSLMKAFLLDPTSPYVNACEKSVLPAWELAHRSTNSQSKGGMTMSTLKPSGFNSLKQSDSLQGKQEQDQRLEALKQQKEFERQEKERTLWREASNPPKIFGENDPLTSDPLPTPEKQEPERGLFAKLKRGKFLD